jgi:tetratricopeptide (TPR) repeat protein
MSGYFFGRAWQYIRSNPGGYMRLLAYKAYLFARGDEIMRNQAIYPFRKYSTVLKVLLWKVSLPGGFGLAFPFGVLLPLAVPGCLLAIRTRHREGFVLLAYGAIYSLSVVAFFITSRYRLPVLVPTILLVAYGWAGVHRWWSDRLVRGLALAGMVALFPLSNWNPGSMSDEMNPDAYYNLANTLADQGDIEGAERYYRKTLELNPADVAAWVNLGLNVYQQRGDLDRAAACYRRALEVRPDYATPVFNLGFIAEQRGRPAVAESLYLEAARLDPLRDLPYVNLASMAMSRGDFEKARGYYREAHLRNPENPAALLGLGVTTSELQGLGQALEFFEKAMRLDPDSPDLYFNLTLAYARAGQFGPAVEYAQKTVELDPTADDAYLVYADIMRSAGRSEQARAFLEAAIRIYPELPGPREALRRLRK